MLRTVLILASLMLIAGVLLQPAPTRGEDGLAKKIGVPRGICVVVNDPQGKLAFDLVENTKLTVFLQVATEQEAGPIRKRADSAGLLGTRLYVEVGADKLPLAANLVDAVLVGGGKVDAGRKKEIVRVLRPAGKAFLPGETITKPFPEGTDDWSHPYHGPDNNPQSRDQIARRPFKSQFFAEPWYAAMPQMSVISGGRIFKVFGNRASARPQWPVMNKMMCYNAFNGALLWSRDLPDGFMLHRSTMIATPEVLYHADDKSLKLIDPATGKVKDEIVSAKEDGPVWKWLGLKNGVLYALVGAEEPRAPGNKGTRFRGAGWPWWGIKDYKFGFGKTILAIDPKSKKVLWRHRDDQPLDSRAMCLSGNRLFFYADNKYLGCLDAKTGKELWKTSDAKLLKAIGAHDGAQHWMKGFASTAYVKCSDDALFFAGPTRKRIVGVSAKDGKLLWDRPGGNSQLVIRDEGLFTLGEGRTNSAKSSFKIEPLTGKVLAEFASRDRCTRATGCIDSIFTRGGKGGSTAIFDITSDTPRKIVLSPMRPSCEDGVVVAHGQLFWGPWKCRCDGTQIGMISLANATDFNFAAEASDAERLTTFNKGSQPDNVEINTNDWPRYRHDSGRSSRSEVTIPAEVKKLWQYQPAGASAATAPVTAGNLTVVADTRGIVRALDSKTGKLIWTSYTGGGMKYPPALYHGRAYVGSGDGSIYCLDLDTGAKLWRFRAAPADRRIPVFGQLLSTWPIGGGVVVDNGVVYAAAGMANYDGTHVYALDAATGKLRWQNNTSGHLHEEQRDSSGAGVQSHLLLHDGALYMSGGPEAPMVAYDLKTGKCSRRGSGRGKDLFVVNKQVYASGTPLYWRPEDSHYIEAVTLAAPGGFVGVAKGQEIVLASDKKQADGKPAILWKAKPFTDVNAIAIGKNAVVVAGVVRAEKGDEVKSTPSLLALNLADGKVLWQQPLPAAAVSYGVALDRAGRILVSLQDGKVACFGK